MLKVQSRKSNTKLKQCRREGKLPGVVYGHGVDSIPFLIDYNQFIQEIKRCGEGALLDLEIDNAEPFKVLWQDYQKEPVSQNFIHVDLYRIKMDEKLRTEITLKFVGEPPAIKTGGILIKSRDYLEVECLPKYLVSEIEVDLLSLAKVHDSLKISDIKVPKGIKVLDDSELMIASIAESAKEEEEVSKEAEKEKISELGKTEIKEGEEKEKAVESKKKEEKEGKS
ncbi:MAG: 50S ribosomal protein L25 [Candidatus Jacksonbacteria bacterium]